MKWPLSALMTDLPHCPTNAVKFVLHVEGEGSDFSGGEGETFLILYRHHG